MNITPSHHSTAATECGLRGGGSQYHWLVKSWTAIGFGVVSANLGKDAWAFCGIGVIGRTGDVRGPHSRERSPLKGAPGGPAGRLWGETLVCFPILSLSRGQVDVELIGTSSPPWAFALPVLLCEAPGPQGHLSLSFIHSWESLWWK